MSPRHWGRERSDHLKLDFSYREWAIQHAWIAWLVSLTFIIVIGMAMLGLALWIADCIAALTYLP